MSLESRPGRRAPNPKQPDDNSNFERIDKIVENTLDNPLLVQGRHGPIACGTDEGFGRKTNEDGIVLTLNPSENKVAFAVIDGMGSYGRGKDATACLAKTLQEGFAVNASFEDMQRAAYKLMQENNLGENGACYLAARIKGKALHMARAGDVRLIVINKDGRVSFSTKDECLDPPDQHIVTNAVSGDDPGRTGINVHFLQEGDRIIVASDHLWDNISNNDLVALIAGKSISETIKIVAAYTEEQMLSGIGKKDNRSLLIYDIKSLPDVEI